jgi:formylglycine-generating enzyme required for sulfatase activity
MILNKINQAITITMKLFTKFLLFLLSIFILTLSSSFYPKREVDAQFIFAMVELNNSTYFDETEIMVEDWLSFYSSVIDRNGLKRAQKVLPDSTMVEPEVWKIFRNIKKKYNINNATHTTLPIGYFDTKCNNAICIKDDYWHRLWKGKKYDRCPYYMLPITGVSYEQVDLFCKWKTVNLGENIITYRLPTEAEWKSIANRCLKENERRNKFPDSLLAESRCPSFSYRSDSICASQKARGANGSMKFIVGQFNVNWEFFDLFGNVSEMVEERGIAKGGNYTIRANQCNVDSVQYYRKSEKWLGFRCIGKVN